MSDQQPPSRLIDFVVCDAPVQVVPIVTANVVTKDLDTVTVRFRQGEPFQVSPIFFPDRLIGGVISLLFGRISSDPHWWLHCCIHTTPLSPPCHSPSSLYLLRFGYPLQHFPPLSGFQISGSDPAAWCVLFVNVATWRTPPRSYLSTLNYM